MKLNLQFIILAARFQPLMTYENDGPQGDGSARCEGCGAGTSGREGGDLRCECGSLIARLVAGRVELKCRRCKRTISLPLAPAREHSRA
jgi:hypothetical protein